MCSNAKFCFSDCLDCVDDNGTFFDAVGGLSGCSDENGMFCTTGGRVSGWVEDNGGACDNAVDDDVIGFENVAGGPDILKGDLLDKLKGGNDFGNGVVDGPRGEFETDGVLCMAESGN